MKRLILFLIVGFIIVSFGYCGETEIVLQAEGRGPNRDQAIKNALYNAVAKAKGVKLESGQYNLGFDSSSADFDRTETGRRVDFDALSLQTQGTLVMTEVEGLVKTYEVLDEKQIDENTYEITLKVHIFDYDSPERTKRLRLAVMPLKTNANSYRFLSQSFSADDISRRLTHELTSALAATNKFSILDRQYITDFAHERNVLISADTPLEEKAKLAKVMGTDYMLVGTIARAEVRIRSTNSTVTGRTLKEYEADYIFEYSLIVGPTRQLKLADSVTIAMRTEGVKTLVERWEPSNLDIEEMTDNLTSMVVKKAVRQIIDAIFPPRIAGIEEDGSIIIAQGGKTLAKGMILDVYTEGREIIDPDTKEYLGKTEILVATIKVDKVAPKISYAKLITGDSTKISEGLICRIKAGPQKAKQTGRTSNIETTSSGGVKLPID